MKFLDKKNMEYNLECGIEFINESIKSAWIIIEIYHNQDNKNV